MPPSIIARAGVFKALVFAGAPASARARASCTSMWVGRETVIFQYYGKISLVLKNNPLVVSQPNLVTSRHWEGAEAPSPAGTGGEFCRLANGPDRREIAGKGLSRVFEAHLQQVASRPSSFLVPFSSASLLCAGAQDSGRTFIELHPPRLLCACVVLMRLCGARLPPLGSAVAGCVDVVWTTQYERQSLQ